MYLRLSVGRSSQSSISAFVIVLTASVAAVASATGASAQSAETAELPTLEVETTAKKKTVKKKPTSEPQPAVTKDTSSGTSADQPVVFSANRTPTDYAKVGSSVSVITEKDIDAQSKTYLQDYLQQVPGVSITSAGGFGQTTTFRLRGFNQNYVKVLVDGMDMSDPSGTQTATAFEHLLVGDVAQVEVLKGSQSTLYGGDALAGVISIDSKYATRPGFFQSGNAEYGTYNTWRGAYTAGYGGLDGSNVAFTVQGVDTDGFSSAANQPEDDGYRNGTISGRGEIKLSDAMTVFFAGRAMDARVNYDSPPLDAFNVVDITQNAGRVGTTITLLDGHFVNTFAVQGMQVTRDYSTPPYTSWYDGDRVKGEYRGVFSFNKQLAVIAGADWERTGSETAFDTQRRTADVTSPYAEVIVQPFEGLVLTGGGRIDDHSMFGQYDTHRFTAAYSIAPTETKFHASYGTGFRAPSLYELFDPFSGNPNLTPETSRSWDVGVDQGFMNNRFGFGATYFDIDMTDRIDYVSVGWAGSYVQVPGLTKTNGVELTAFAKLAPNLIVNGAYTYTDSEEPDGTRVTRLPRHNFLIGFTAQPIDKLSVNVTGQYLADNLDSVGYPAVDQKVDDYFLLSAKIGYEVLPGTVAYVRGENLLDQDYTTVVNYQNAGLTVFGGVQFALPAN